MMLFTVEIVILILQAVATDQISLLCSYERIVVSKVITKLPSSK